MSVTYFTDIDVETSSEISKNCCYDVNITVNRPFSSPFWLRFTRIKPKKYAKLLISASPQLRRSWEASGMQLRCAAHGGSVAAPTC